MADYRQTFAPQWPSARRETTSFDASTVDPTDADPPVAGAEGIRVSDLPFPYPSSDHHRITNALWLIENNPSGRPLLPVVPEGDGDAPRFAAVVASSSDGSVADQIAAQLAQEVDAPSQIAQRSKQPARPNPKSVGSPDPKFDQFFEQHYEPVLKEATKLGIDPALMLGLSAHESNWGTSNQATKMNNPFGRTPDGRNPVVFPSMDAAWQAWTATHGSRTQGTGSNAEEFLDRLLLDNRTVYGPTIGGDRLGAYNDPRYGDRNWKPKVLGVIQSVRNRLPRWQAARNMLPQREE